MSGSVLAGRYRLEASIGSGGMAEVFRAFDTTLDRPVAVKILAPQYATDPGFVDRFRREAQAAARLNHPNVVSVYDSGSDDGTHFIVMEYIEGRTLADFLARGGRLDPTKAVEIAMHIADALDAAHAQGVIHRDIKSGNVMVTRTGVVKVMDFGIARIAEGADNVTQTAAVLGTASYLSPEQAQGRPVDVRSDIYSLGVVLYEMLTGRPPFTGDTAMAVAYRHVNETPPHPSSKNMDVSPALDAVVMRALAKNPANRYATAREFHDDLERVTRGETVRATPLMPVGGDATQVIRREQTSVMDSLPPDDDRRNIWVGILIGLLIVAVLGGGLFLLATALLNDNNGTPSPSVTPIPYPSVIGKTREEAASALSDFTNVNFDEKPAADPNSPKIGTVTAQDPDPDTVESLLPTDEITLTVTVSPDTVTIPEGLVGQNVDDAVAELEALGLIPQQTTDTTSGEAPGTVLVVDPPEGTDVPANSTVTLTVAAEPDVATVPDVTCQSYGSAKKDLREEGFVAVLSSETRPLNPLCPNGSKIAAQDPEGNTQAPVGSTVTLFLGEEPSPSPS
ncbi:MAG TPA: Stk1 family PASTA domain-containing Ser/Thr kinase [Actinomycetota bacterium]